MSLELECWWSKETFLYCIVSGVIEDIGYYFPLMSICPFHFFLFCSLSYIWFFIKYQAEIDYTKNEPHIYCSMRSL